ncbi:MAG: hypothetical protein ACRDVC_04475 [Acidimicrobiales bacterium]
MDRGRARGATLRFVIATGRSWGPHGQAIRGGGVLKEITRNGKTHFVVLHHFAGYVGGFEAWHKVAMVVILVAFAALAVAGIDGLRRSAHRNRRAREAT